MKPRFRPIGSLRTDTPNLDTHIYVYTYTYVYVSLGFHLSLFSSLAVTNEVSVKSVTAVTDAFSSRACDYRAYKQKGRVVGCAKGRKEIQNGSRESIDERS